MIYTSANSHLGDAVWHAHILRRLGGKHEFYVPPAYLTEIAECLEGTEVEVKDIVFSPPDALSTWIACGRFHQQGLDWQCQTDLIDYLMKWGNYIAREARRTELLFRHRQEWLCDFPAIQKPVEAPEFDVLIVNAKPGSAQVPEFNDQAMDELISKLTAKHKVLCTNPTAVDAPRISTSICGIASLANRAKIVVAVSTGASACIHNVYGEPRTLLLLAPIVLDYGRTNLSHFNNCAEVEAQLVKEGWL